MFRFGCSMYFSYVVTGWEYCYDYPYSNLIVLTAEIMIFLVNLQILQVHNLPDESENADVSNLKIAKWNKKAVIR